MGILQEVSALKGCKDDMSLLLVGLTGAGKSTLMDRLLDVGDVDPSQGLQKVRLETFLEAGFKVMVWDTDDNHLGEYWEMYYFERTDCVVFVVDARDRESLASGKVHAALAPILVSKELIGVPLLIVLNMADMKDAITLKETVGALEVDSITTRAVKVVQATSHGKGDSLHQGFRWCAENYKSPRTSGLFG